jgi:glycine/D-amino acid oxidase-like deaminating enzyme
MKILIVGGGIAGLCTAIELMKRKIPFTLIDQGNNNSTLTAAGMINPIVFRRTTKSWRVDEFLPYLIEFYQKIEKETAQSFFHPLKLRRIFSSNQEREEWLKRQSRLEYQEYLEEMTLEDESYNLVNTPFGTGRVKQCYWVNSEVFMAACQVLLASKVRMIHEKFNHNEYNPESKKYKNETYDKVIFCEGGNVSNNALFKFLDIRPTKGQLLTISAKDIPENESLNRKCFVLPIGNHQFKIGSTYEWNATDSLPTHEGKQAILENFQILTKNTPEIIDHTAGIRPTTFDRRPFLGEHQKFRDNFIFNGLGTKGYMIAPLLSNELVDHILEGSPLHQEVLIERVKNTNE